MNDIEIEILLVEDNQDDANLAIRALRKKNLANKLLHLKDGAEALDFIFGTGAFEGRGTNFNSKVVLLDLKMPRINGLEVLQRLKSNTQTKMIPVVVLTSSAEDPDIKTAYELGANSFIVKPVEFDNFVQTIVDLGMYWVALNRAPY
ncbi:MAG TPA: response regulator [Cyclobacteriaceae bacterium]|jgi:CheY-like chemotaxis protein|nr:response regulator [Cyclobacteriaceae bacterium]